MFATGWAQLREIGSARVLLDVPAGPLAPLRLDQTIESPDRPLELVALDTAGAVTGRIAQAEQTR